MVFRESVVAGGLALTFAMGSSARAEAAEAGARASLPIGPAGLAVSVAPPAGWSPIDDANLPEIDVSAFDGATVSLRAGWAHTIADARSPHDDRLVVVCATASADDYAPGLETAIFERMNDVVRAELGKQASVERLETYPIEARGARFEQRFSARGEVGAGLRDGKVRVGEEAPDAVKPALMRADGRHVVGFAGEPASMAACSTVCVEADAGEGSCAPALASLTFEGPFGPPPTPKLLARALAAAVTTPLAAAGVLFGAITTAAGLLIALRARARA